MESDLIAIATRSAFHRLIAWTLETQPDALVLAGDIFDGQWRAAATRRVFLEGLDKLDAAGIPVVMVSGNHDAESVLQRGMVVPPSVRRLPVDAAASIPIPGTNLVIHGQGYAQRAVTENLAQHYPDSIPGVVNVGVLHANVGLSAGHDNYAPCSEEDLLRLGYDYVALGHVHTRRVFTRDRTFAAYPGNLQGRSVRELGPKGALLVTLEPGAEPIVEFQPLDVLRWAHANVDATESGSPVDVVERVATEIQTRQNQADGRPQIVRVDLQVTDGMRSRLQSTTALREDIRDAVRGVIVEKVKVRAVAAPDASIDPVLAEAVRQGAEGLDRAEVLRWLADLNDRAHRHLRAEGTRLDDRAYIDALIQRATDDLVQPAGVSVAGSPARPARSDRVNSAAACAVRARATLVRECPTFNSNPALVASVRARTIVRRQQRPHRRPSAPSGRQGRAGPPLLSSWGRGTHRGRPPTRRHVLPVRRPSQSAPPSRMSRGGRAPVRQGHVPPQQGPGTLRPGLKQRCVEPVADTSTPGTFLAVIPLF